MNIGFKGTLTIEQGGRRASWGLDYEHNGVDITAIVPHGEVVVEIQPEQFTVIFNCEEEWNDDVNVEVKIELPGSLGHPLFPSYQGDLIRDSRADARWEFRGPGWQGSGDPSQRLAIPLAIAPSGNKFLMIGADPLFMSNFSVPRSGICLIEWTMRAAAGVHTSFSRTLHVGFADSIASAVNLWFERATPMVPEGPSWLHEIAWQHYDYMSKNGAGWFKDIDAVCEIVAPEDRNRVAFTMHGWYDVVGRYCYDKDEDRLDSHWTIFPFVENPNVQALEGVEVSSRAPKGYVFKNLDKHRPIVMDWEELRGRLKYAKDRGFRVPFYLMTGMMDIGEPATHIENGDGLNVQVPLWVGPDAIGPTYLRNPLHATTKEWLFGLTRSILAEIGDLIDALVIDEAYYVGYGQLGPNATKGYADRAQAELFRELATICHEFKPSLALLTADHIGTQELENQAFPYSLFADGIYHDAWSNPQNYDAVRWPTWRNVAWSCLWTPVTEILSTKWCVMKYDAAISTGAGCFGDDVNIYEMQEDERDILKELWQIKSSRRLKKFFTVNEIVDAR